MRRVTLEIAQGITHETGGLSPIGQTAEEVSAELAAADEEYSRLEEEYREIHEIARQVVHFRTLNHLTQRQLAELVGTSYSQIARLESGLHKPSVDTLQRIARALGRRLRITFEPPATAARPDVRATRAEAVEHAVDTLMTEVATAYRGPTIKTMVEQQHKLSSFGNHRPLVTAQDSKELVASTPWAA